MRDRLACEHGIMLVQPPFSRYYLELGEISSYPPGYKENGGVFCQVNPWIMIAETMLGNGEAAFDYYKRTNPSARAPISDVHRCEPYVYAQMIAGRDAASAGEAKNSWLTGSSFVAHHGHLAVDSWRTTRARAVFASTPSSRCPGRGFTARRRWRGATYEIVVHQEPGVQGRVQRLVVDGTNVEGNLVRPAPQGRPSGRCNRGVPPAVPFEQVPFARSPGAASDERAA